MSHRSRTGLAVLLAVFALVCGLAAWGAEPPVAAAQPLIIELNEIGTSSPVAGASVKVRADSDSLNAQPTDAAGRATVQLPRPGIQYLHVEASLEGWAPMAFSWRKPADGSGVPPTIRIEMERATTIGGRVVDDAGQAIAGATVMLHVHKKYSRPEQRVAVTYKSAKTDDDGRWTYTGVPAEFDSINLGVFHHRYASGPGFYSMSSFTPLAALRDRSATLTLERGTLIEGIVRGADGKPIAGAKVGYGRDRVASNVLPEQSTDEQGRFVCAAKAGDMAVITVKAPGHAPELKQFTVGQSTTQIAFDLKPAQTLTGQVVDGDGRPIAGVRIYLDTWRGSRTLNTSFDTDAEGRFTWKDAPDDDVLADIMRIGYADNRGVPIRAGAANRVVLQSPTVVKGTVVDAETGQPVPAFQIITGIDFKNGRPIHWQRPQSGFDRSQGKDGKFQISLTYPYPGYAIRVEADGYLPASSEPFALDGKEKALSFKLSRGQALKGTVRNVDGQPLAGAEVVLVTASSSLQLSNGRVPEYAARDAVRATTGADGSFAFPPQSDPCLLVVVHDAGHAQVTDEQWKADPAIKLQPWGLIEGTARIGTRPAAKQGVAVHLRDNRGYDPSRPSVYAHYTAETDEQGRFRFDRVIPGEVSVARAVRLSESMTGFSNATKATVEPGKTVQVTLGGTGRPVVGRLIIPDDIKQGSWMLGHSGLSTQVKPPSLPDAFHQMTLEERQAWLQTPEGKAFADAQQKAYEQARHYAVPVEADGSFRIDDVAEGDYQLRIMLAEPPRDRTCGPGDELATLAHEFAVPPVPGGVSDEPLVLPPLPVQRVNRVKVGDLAPDFAFKTLDDEPRKLADFKGKYILLDFWATWCGPCLAETPHLKAAYEAFGNDPRFVLIGLSMDQAMAAPKKYAQANDLKWVHGFLGAGAENQAVSNLYGVRGIPSIWLIGPDGKVIARDLRGEAIKTAIGSAMERQ